MGERMRRIVDDKSKTSPGQDRAKGSRKWTADFRRLFGGQQQRQISSHDYRSKGFQDVLITMLRKADLQNRLEDRVLNLLERTGSLRLCRELSST